MRLALAEGYAQQTRKYDHFTDRIGKTHEWPRNVELFS
jgi:hypothetical protein